MGGRLRPWQGSPPGLYFREHEDMPQNAVAATSGLKTFNLIPAVGEQRASGQFTSCIYNSVTERPWAVTALPYTTPSWPSPGRMMSFLKKCSEVASVQAWISVLGWSESKGTLAAPTRLLTQTHRIRAALSRTPDPLRG